MEGKDRLTEEVAVIDFDMLCSSVARQTQGVKLERRIAKEEEDDDGEPGIVAIQRMWEGDVLGCVENRWISSKIACCPCIRFGRNMERAGLGLCFVQGTIYLSLVVLAFLGFIAFGITKRQYFFYLGVATVILVGLYAGYFRSRIRKLFNIRGSVGSLEDTIIHLLCPCCALCQESRTLEMNNVHDGIWHGRGDIICIGKNNKVSKEFNLFHKASLIPTKNPESCTMDRYPNGTGISSSEHLILSIMQNDAL